jgi:hypothetical protein
MNKEMKGQMAVATLMSLGLAMDPDLGRRIDNVIHRPESDVDPERDERIERVKAAAEARRQQRNARRLARWNGRRAL